MQPVRLSLEPPRVEGPSLVLAAVLQHPDGPRERLWWRLPAEWRDGVTPWADPFVVALLFPMMQWQRDVMVEGSVSPSLLSNLEQFMAIWRMWVPGRYRPVEIRASQEAEAPPPAQEGQAIVAFSCGVDSSFTLYRHCRGLAGRRTHRVGAAMVMHGFDIWPDQQNADGMFAGLLEGARAMTDSLAVACVPVATNFHELKTVWAHSFGTQLVGGLRLLAGRFDSALIAGEQTYTHLYSPWASHPVTNPHLSSRHFQVIDDGGEAVRFEKIQAIADWPQALRHLRVCFENPGSHLNCCRCEKCIRTILAFRIAGLDLPPALPRDVSNRQIRRVHIDVHHPGAVRQWPELLDGAKTRGLKRAGWVRAVRTAIRRNRWRYKWRVATRALVPLRNFIRRIFRGSPLSRRELERMSAGPQPPSSLS